MQSPKLEINRDLMIMNTPLSGEGIVTDTISSFVNVTPINKPLNEKNFAKNIYKVFVYRDPRHILGSTCLLYSNDMKFFESSENVCMKSLRDNIPSVLRYFNVLSRATNVRNIFDTIFLKYETFNSDKNIIIDSVCDLIDHQYLDDEDKSRIIESVGKHSSTEQETDKLSWKEIIPDQYHEYVNSNLYIPLNEWGYEADDCKYLNFY
jgi:hypothetical protein